MILSTNKSSVLPSLQIILNKFVLRCGLRCNQLLILLYKLIMIPLRTIISIISLFHAVKSFGFSQNFTFDDKGFLIDIQEISTNSIDINSLRCTSDNCVISQKTFAIDNPTNILRDRTCSDIPHEASSTDVFLSLKKLNDNKLLIDYIEMEFNSLFILFSKSPSVRLEHVLQVIDLKNCELSEMAKIDVSLKDFGKVLIRPDNSGLIDVFYTDSKKCNDQVKTVITYDSELKIVNGPDCLIQLTPNTILKGNSDITTFSEEEYFLLDENDHQWGGYLMNFSDYKIREVFHGECDSPGCPPDFRVSTKNGLITYCLLPKNYPDSVDCFIINPNTTAKKNLTLTYPHKILEFEVLNLANGEFVTLSNRFKKFNSVQKREKRNYFDKMIEEIRKANIWMDEVDFELRRYSNNGTIIGKPFSIPGTSCRDPTNRSRPSITEDGNNQICVSTYCENTEKGGAGSYHEKHFVRISIHCSNI